MMSFISGLCLQDSRRRVVLRKFRVSSVSMARLQRVGEYRWIDSNSFLMYDLVSLSNDVTTVVFESLDSAISAKDELDKTVSYLFLIL